MSDIFSLPLEEVLAVSASDSPTPGGGSVSAMVACFGAAMAAMVGNLTVNKEKFKDVEYQVKEILDGATQVMSRLKELVGADINEFNNFMRVLRLPKSTDEEKIKREQLMQEALQGATNTPLEIARTCLTGLALAERLSPIGNKMAISDDGVAAYVLEAALNAVLLSCDINLPMIKDQSFVQKVILEKNELKEKAREYREKTLAVVTERMK